MKSNSLDELQNHNLVMFPSSKNFKIDLVGIDTGPDPLHELLNEYSNLKDEDGVVNHLDDEFEVQFKNNFEDELEVDTYHSLEAFMTRNLRGETQDPDDKLVKLINDRISAIKDAKERIKFYLDEIEMFLPSRKK